MPQNNRPGCFNWLIKLGLLVWFVLALGNEIKLVAWFFIYKITTFLRVSVVSQPPNEEVGKAILIFIVYLSIPACLFLLSFILSQTVLPVRTFDERWQAFSRFWSKAANRHGPVVFTKEGKVIIQAVEAVNNPGTVWVDGDSALVLERPLYAPAPFGYTHHAQRSRVINSALTFTGKFEKVRGVVNLRKQFRISEPGEVKGYTADGIEVKTSVFAIFSISQPARIVKVAPFGPQASDLRVLQFDERTRRIKAITDELDAKDKEDIFEFARGYNFSSGSFAYPLPDDEPR